MTQSFQRALWYTPLAPLAAIGDVSVHCSPSAQSHKENAAKHTGELVDEMTCSLSPVLLQLLETNGYNDELMWDVEHMLHVRHLESITSLCLVSFTCRKYIHFNQAQ